MELSRRALSLKPSATLAVTSQARQMRREGVDVLSFAAGEPDFDTPAPIREAAKRALDEGLTRYAPTPGDPEARGAIAAKLQRENGIPGVTPDHVVVSVGGKGALYNTFQALLDPPVGGEAAQEVILPTPAWVSYAPQAMLSGGRIVEVPTTPQGGFKVTPAQLRDAITERSRVLVFNSPSNPCGVSYTPDEVRALAGVIAERAAAAAPNLVVIADEIYERIVYAGATHLSIGSIPEVAERVVTINGLSKAFSMTGWRIGYLAGSGEFGRKVATAAATLQSQTTTAITSFCMPAIRVALEECADDVERMRLAFGERAEVIYGALSSMPGMVCPRPTGAFYVFPDVSAHFGKRSAGGAAIDSALTFCAALLKEHHVAAVPGEDFLGCGGRCVRLSFACSREQIEKGMQRVGEFVAGLK